ncbi:MAG: hypothetical protein D3924_19550 [Candidatus Electrothrix sp. AR4]|nr:hypothetical protein [Candidatus Electrothrix sp. AR4]
MIKSRVVVSIQYKNLNYLLNDEWPFHENSSPLEVVQSGEDIDIRVADNSAQKASYVVQQA